MVFKRRDPRSWAQTITEFLYPRGGWTRAFHYVRHRVRRLPDTPERIARGIWAGVFTCFTPFFGFHFVIAGLIAALMRGNLLAALMSTFVGNPATFVPIAAISMRTGHLLLGTEFEEENLSLGAKIQEASGDLWHNFLAIFTDRVADWHGLTVFYHEVFFPYMVGGLIPGATAATVAYYLSVPLIRAYQNRRRRKIKAKFDAIKARAGATASPAGADAPDDAR